MFPTVLINCVKNNATVFAFKSLAIAVVMASLGGCLSHIDKVAPQEDMPTMKQVYEEQTGSGGTEALQQREADIRARPVAKEDYLTEVHPYPGRIQHLFPALPNPELFMYVKPHVVGSSGAVVPAYITRFTMYERTHYAMPNEVVSQVKHPGVVFRAADDTAPKKADQKKNDVCNPLILCE